MGNVIIIFFVLGLIRTCHPSSTFWTKSSVVPFSKGEDDAMASVSASSSIACAVQCHDRMWCNSLSFTPHNGTCDLYSFHYVSGVAAKENDVTKFYRSYSKTCRVKDHFQLDRGSGMCVLVVMSPGVAAWQDAFRECEEKGLRLVSLYTSSRLDFVINMLRHNARFHDMDYFIGGKRPLNMWDEPWPGGEPDLQWLHNGIAVDTNTAKYWNPGEPNNAKNKDNVLVLAKLEDDFLLTDSPDTRSPARLGYICEK